MPQHLSRQLTGARRSDQGNRRLGYLLAFVAGALNAGGFLAVQQYTSHMTGILSEMADMIALGQYRLAFFGLACLISFILGAALSAFLVNLAHRRQWHSAYAIPLVVEAGLLAGFGLVALIFGQITGQMVTATILSLCFVMGLQNAVMTKISGAVIRTTHVTGIATDLGIDMGRWLFRRLNEGAGTLPPPVRSTMLLGLLIAFFGGGIGGAFGFQALGFAATLPLAAALLAASLAPLYDDLTARP
jgi:uncharacterized membrane protein YoaK (UPF0700 family)